MAIFPKIKKKSVPKFYPGGTISTATPQDPILGVGLQYIPTAPNLPNLDAVKYYDNVRRASDAKLDAEREKLMPNEQATRDLILKLPGTAGQKELLLGDFLKGLKDYRTKARQNINWVFNDEARTQMSNLENMISPAKFQKLNENYRQLQSSYDNAYKNNTLDNYQVRDGRISVIDQSDGKRKDIPLREYQNDVKSEKPKFNPLKVADAFDLANNEQAYDLSGHKVYGDMYNADQAKDELKSAFNNLGVTGDSNGLISTKSNEAQRAQAKMQALNSLSSKSKEALQSEYIKLSKGQYDEREFTSWVGNILDEESRKRAISDKQVNMSAIAALSKPVKGSTEGSGPVEVPVNASYPVTRDKNPLNPFGSKTVDLHLITRGTPTDDSIKPLVLNGDYFVFGDTFGGPKLSEDKNGEPVRLVKTFKNAQHVENATFAVTTGNILKLQKDGTFSLKQNGQAGKMIIKNEDYQDNIPKDAIMMQDVDQYGKPYLYFQNEKGDRIIVQSRGFKVYDVYGNYDKDASELKNDYKIFVPVDRKESIAMFGSNYSGEHHNEIHFYKKGNVINLTPQAYHILAAVISNTATVNPGYAKALKDQVVAAQKGSWQAQHALDKIVNEELDGIDDQNIKNSLLTPKETYTPSSASDNRNFNN